MTSWIRVSLILLPILGQVCRGEFKYCQEAVDNVESVSSCPTSEKEWEGAANRKNCQLTAAQQTCSEPEAFLYHCVINGYGNETLEVCAPRRLMIGFCTEFNVAGGVIQSHVSAPCNKTSVLRCDDVYYSTHAFKYPGCYDIVYKKQTISSTTIAMPNKTIRSDQSKNRKMQIIVAVVVAVVIVICIVIIVIGVILSKRRRTRTPDITDMKEIDTLITDRDGNRKGVPKFKCQKKLIEEEIEDPYTPGKPIANASGIRSDSVDLQWAKPANSVDYYQIRYKTKDENDEWKLVETKTDQSKITITGLMANTKYVFQVRSINQDQEGQYGPESNDVLTAESLSTSLLDFSKLVSNGSPSKYQLLVTELENSRNIDAKTKQVIFGGFKQTDFEKTIMLVGATGSGKSTIVDGIVNYMMGVKFDDPFRLTLIQLEEEEQENKEYKLVVSQTEWITVYKIIPKGASRLTYTLNIIDTPGFGDTREFERNQRIIDQIRQLFLETGAKGVLFLDALCFVVKAPDARLTVAQKYMFCSILSLFGKDINSNICTLITFADGAEPPIRGSLKEADIPFGSTFQFNNSALFAENTNLTSTSLLQVIWDMGFKSFQKFFEEISHFKTKSLSLTREVLQERDQLKNITAKIVPHIEDGLKKLSELQTELSLLEGYKNDIKCNADFEYEVEESFLTLVQLDSGHYVTNCLCCNITCHDNCDIADDDGKSKCRVMKDGFCTVCSGKCSWTVHKNSHLKFVHSVKKVKKTYFEMKRRYEEAIGRKLSQECLIENLISEIKNMFETVDWKNMMAKMNCCKSRLKEIELRPDPLCTLEHLDTMIQAENHEKQPGYQSRIKKLRKLKDISKVEEDYEQFDFLSEFLTMEKSSCDIKSTTLKRP